MQPAGVPESRVFQNRWEMSAEIASGLQMK
jgi:hypothetical protein